MNAIRAHHALPSHLWMIHFNFIFPLTARSSELSSSYICVVSHTYHGPTRLILLHFHTEICSFQTFPEIAGMSWSLRVRLWINKCTLTSFVTLEMWSEGTALKNEEFGSWFLLRDNTPAHQLVLVKDFLAKNNVTTLEHPLPPQPLDQASADFCLFIKLKSASKGQHFCYPADFVKNVTE